MDKNKLSQLRHLKKEIEILKNQIDNINLCMTTDMVKGSDVEFPFVLHDIKIIGLDIKNYKRKLKRLKTRQARRVKEFIDLIEEMDEYIENVDDSLIRQILILRYAKGLSWEHVATGVGGNNTADSVRMLHNRFLKI